jgi:outer membrane protein OmpA-like peptidoglycan-associated protein
MKKLYLGILLAGIITPLFLQAQTFPGYRTDNYTGVNGVFFNPANIADSRYKFDINLFSINGFVGNNQGSLGVKDLTKTFNSDSLKSFLFGRNNGHISSLINADVYGPSVMFNLGRRSAMAITTRARVFSNARNIDGTLAQTFIDGGAASTGVTYPANFTASNSNINAAAWSEYGLSYSTVLSPDNSTNFFKAGVTVKYLAGTADAYLKMNNTSGTINYNNAADGTYLTNTKGDISINTTDANFSDYKFKDFFKFNGHGVGADFGLIYEYRPESMTHDNYKYQDDRFANKYKLKVGVAVLDVGKIKFNKTNASSGNYTVDIPDGQQFYINQFKNQSINNYVSVLDSSSFFTRAAKGANDDNKYNVSLPTTVQANIDYNINSSFFVNFNGQFALNEKKDLNLFAYNSYSITPRFESKWFGVSVPFNYNSLTKFNAGLSLRAGPVFVGSGSAFTALLGKSKQADFHAGVHIGIPYSKKLKPDTDGDGIFDDKDKCPAVFGLVRYDGCPIPDSDGDSINDEEDKCPTVAGLARYNGCPIPDTDNDGVNDERDKCPTVAGLAKYDGCPVPDTDSDGVNDEQDKCPTLAGDAKNMGCPDTDGDGVIDPEDLCPNEAGPASSKGCPAEKVAVQITAEFKNILFDFGKATIRPESMNIIVNATKTMNEQIPNSGFYIDGYTDNVGSGAANKSLSKKRAQAVANALINAGIAKDRIIARGLGEENPKCDNKTDEGRQCNRRVEVTIRNIDQKKESEGYKLKN